MPSSRWNYDPERKRFKDAETGRTVSTTQVQRLRDRFTRSQLTWGDDMADLLQRGGISVQGWLQEFRAKVKQVYLDEYMLGRGGRNVMTPSDWGRVGQMVRQQYDYAQRFAEEVANGTLSRDAIANRSGLYFESATVAFEQGRQAAYQGLVLPRHPGDGHTRCLVRCKCSWSIEETTKEWRCTWRLNPSAEHCEDCEANAAKWAPLVLPKT